MDCSSIALLAALRLAVSLLNGGSFGVISTTLECTKCKCPNSTADVMECKAEEMANKAKLQRDREQGYKTLELLISACGGGSDD